MLFRSLSSFASATTAISMVAAAYSAEIFRAGIEAVPRGQFEAARAVGLPPWLAMSKVILPQAIKIVIPPLTSNSINVMKDTALASVVAMPDLLKQANQAQALAANPTPLIVAALIYLVILLPLVRLVGWFGAGWAKEIADAHRLRAGPFARRAADAARFRAVWPGRRDAGGGRPRGQPGQGAALR